MRYIIDKIEPLDKEILWKKGITPYFASFLVTVFDKKYQRIRQLGTKISSHPRDKIIKCVDIRDSVWKPSRWLKYLLRRKIRSWINHNHKIISQNRENSTHAEFVDTVRQKAAQN